MNVFLKSELGLPDENYYSRLGLEGFLRLKSVLSDINNILTLKVSLAFAEWVTLHLELNNAARLRIPVESERVFRFKVNTDSG